MEAGNKKVALGRGLDALFGEGEAGAVVAPSGDAAQATVGAKDGTPYQIVDIDLVEPNPKQPRRFFNEEELEELAASIRENGVIQPIIVRVSPHNSELFEIVAGERRWRAAQRAALHEVPVVVRELDDREAMAFAIIENVQRSDLNAIEESMGYQQLIDRFAYTQEQLAEIVGKSRPHIANMLRLNSLSDGVRDLVREGRLSAGHARAVLGAADADALAQKAVAKGWSVRQTEQAVKAAPKVGKRGGGPRPQKDADTALLEGELSLALQTGVTINDRGGKGGEVVIAYRSGDDLERIAQHLKSMGESVLAGSV